MLEGSFSLDAAHDYDCEIPGLCYVYRAIFGEVISRIFYLDPALPITKTRLYNFHPLTPHFYIVKLGFTGVYFIVLISAQKHRLWVLVKNIRDF